MNKHIIVLLLAFVTVNAAVQGQRRRAAATKKIACDSNILTNLDRCCDMPKLLQIEYVTNCFNALKNMTILESETTNCLVECVLKAQNVLSSSGAIDVNKAVTEFVTPVMNIWQPVVTKSINTCANELAAKMPNWKPVAQSCNPRPALFMSCVGHYLALECPKASTPTTTEENCDAKKAHLAACSPFVDAGK